VAGNWSELRDILDWGDLPPSEKLVFLALRIRQGSNASCWPSQERIASDTGLSKRSVRTITRNLERLGLIRIGRRSDDGRSKEYVLKRGNSFPHFASGEKGETASPNWRQSATEIAEATAPEEKKNEKGNEKERYANARLSCPKGLRASRDQRAMSAEEVACMQADPVAYWAAREANA
jgi:hypothetical protein